MKNPGAGLRAHCPTYAGVRSGSDWALGRDDTQSSVPPPNSCLLCEQTRACSPGSAVSVWDVTPWITSGLAEATDLPVLPRFGVPVVQPDRPSWEPEDGDFS